MHTGALWYIWNSLDRATRDLRSKFDGQWTTLTGGRRHLQELKPRSHFLLNKELFINTEGERELVVALTIASTIVIYLISALSV